jgi:hypothetical protein
MACYIAYRVIAKHLPEQEEFRYIGSISTSIRRFLCKPLFRRCSGTVTVGRGAELRERIQRDNGGSCEYRAFALIEDSCATVTIGQHCDDGQILHHSLPEP